MKPLESSNDPATSQAPPTREDRSAQVADIFHEHNRTLIGFLINRLHNEQEAMENAPGSLVQE